MTIHPSAQKAADYELMLRCLARRVAERQRERFFAEERDKQRLARLERRANREIGRLI
jgi:hypothetical protein